jgi:hypothetical protein
LLPIVVVGKGGIKWMFPYLFFAFGEQRYNKTTKKWQESQLIPRNVCIFAMMFD